jgi:hypothetical protein
LWLDPLVFFYLSNDYLCVQNDHHHTTPKPQAIVMGPMTTKHYDASKSPKRAEMAVEAVSATAKVRTAATAMAVVAAGDKRELETVAF